MSHQLEQLQRLLHDMSLWEDRIKEALHHGRDTHTFDDIVQLVLTNRALFFTYEHCFVLMEKVTYPQFAVFHCFLAGGDMEAVLATHDQMEQIGRDLGCKYLSMAGRKGWERQLKSHGWKFVCTTMYREIGELNDGQWEGRTADYASLSTARH